MAGRVLRFHPALWLDENRPSVPGLIAAFRPIIGDLHPEAPPAAIHRVYLNPDGSAIRDEHGKRVKRMLGPSKGCAIKLTADEEVKSGLGIVRGSRTDSAGSRRAGPDMGPRLGRRHQAASVLSESSLTIFADHDAKGHGIAAAKVCSDRWREAGIEVITRIRNKTGDDWADGEGEQ